MKRRLFTFALAALTIGLLGSCSKINERIDDLDKRVYDLENTKIASIEQQITAINTSINELKAADVTINGKIADLKTAADAQQALIDALQEADRALGQKDDALEARIATLEGQVTTINGQIDDLVNADIAINTRIDTLSTYVDTQIGKAKDWATATFASLTEYKKTAEDLAKLSVTVEGISTTLADVQTSIAGLDAKIDGIDVALQEKITTAKTELEGEISDLKTDLEGEIADAIAASETSLQGWVNKQLEGYYTIAQVDAKVKGLQDQIDNLKKDDETKTKIAELESNLKKLTQDLENAKTTITAEYDAAIKKAIEENNGTITKTIQSKIDEVNATITALTGRVEALESDVATLKNDVAALKAMIQTVSIIPAYSNGSLKAEDGILTINCVITPKEAVESLARENFTILTSESEVLTKSALYGTLTIAKDEDLVLDKTNGTATIKVDVSSVLPAEEDKALTVAVNIKNGISDFTTEFVPVYVYVAPAPVAPEGFVDLGVKDANGKPLFWAECNLGASNPQDHGDYFAWGETAPYYTTTGGWPATPAWKEGKGNGYAWQSYCGSSSFSEWSTPPYDATSNILKPEFDAATAANSSWRTPTRDEFLALVANCVWIWTTDYNSTGKAGYIVYKAKSEEDKGKVNRNGTWKKWGGSSYSADSVTTGSYSISDTHIFFPAAGKGSGTSLFNAGSQGRYWSSSLNSSSKEGAYDLYFSSTNDVDPSTRSGRYYGCSVRPVTSGAAPAPTPTTTGTAKATIGELQVDVKWIQLWENGPKFAEYNVGVTNGKAESYGGYYTWGGTYNNDPDLPGFSWTDDHNLLHTTDNDNLTSTEDTATKLWGENWRMPTKAELEALINSTNCTVEWTTVGGVYGRKFTGKTEPYSSNSVFLPAAGCCYKNSEGDIEHDSGRDGYYWPSTSKGSNSAYFLYFFESSYLLVADNSRHIGSSVRAVLAE